MASCDEAMKKLIFLAMTSKDRFDCIKRMGERLSVIRNKLEEDIAIGVNHGKEESCNEN